MEILYFEDLGDTECHLAAKAVVLVPGEVSNFNSKVPQGDIYPHITFERDKLNIFRVRVFTSSGSTRGRGDAKTIISPNTSFGDLINRELNFHGNLFSTNKVFTYINIIG